MDCVFCKIINKEISSYTIYEDDESVAILDIHPQSPGHAMILPRFHAENILGLPEDKVGAVFKAAKRVTRMLNNALKPDGFTIGINHGRASGSTVDHLHIHIVPRFTTDGGGSVHSVVNNPPKESLEEIIKKIKAVGF